MLKHTKVIIIVWKCVLLPFTKSCCTDLHWGGNSAVSFFKWKIWRYENEQVTAIVIALFPHVDLQTSILEMWCNLTALNI